MSTSRITFGSLFAGIGGFDLGFERAGMRGLWQVEKDHRCRKVLETHFSKTKRYEDVQRVGKSNLAPVDVLCGGFPCQDLSVAGKRKGLAGERSGLWWHFHRIIGECQPRLVVIENVPGLYSSNEGRDFYTLIHSLVELGYRAAWRVLDSQYDRVAQRRQRVFIVGSLGTGRAAQILFEPESVCWDSAPGRTAREDITGSLGGGSGSRGWSDDLDRSGAFIAGAVTSKWAKGTGGPSGDECQNIVTHALSAEGHDASGGGQVENATAQALRGGAEHNYQFARIGTGVRRLTPVECERLQGFPDNWTAGQSDSVRYRQLGNAVTVNVAEWLGRRIVQFL
jgi:DNA (cytosine-5)-methyltransferase 1